MGNACRCTIPQIPISETAPKSIRWEMLADVLVHKSLFLKLQSEELFTDNDNHADYYGQCMARLHKLILPLSQMNQNTFTSPFMRLALKHPTTD